jgi:hypothetical protein
VLQLFQQFPMPTPSGTIPDGSGMNPEAWGFNPQGWGNRFEASGMNPDTSGKVPDMAGMNPVPTGRRPALAGTNPARAGNRPEVAKMTAEAGIRDILAEKRGADAHFARRMAVRLHRLVDLSFVCLISSRKSSFGHCPDRRKS